MKSMIYRDLLLFIKKNYKILILIILLLVLKTIFNYNDFINATNSVDTPNNLSQSNVIDLTPFVYTENLFFERSLGLTYDIDGIIEIIYMCLIISLYIYIAVSVYFSDIASAPEQLFLRMNKKKYVMQKLISITAISILIDIILYLSLFITLSALNVSYFNFELLFINIFYKIILQFIVIALFGYISIYSYFVVLGLLLSILTFKIKYLYFLFPSGVKFDIYMVIVFIIISAFTYWICHKKIISLFRKEKMYGI